MRGGVYHLPEPGEWVVGDDGEGDGYDDLVTRSDHKVHRKRKEIQVGQFFQS